MRYVTMMLFLIAAIASTPDSLARSYPHFPYLGVEDYNTKESTKNTRDKKPNTELLLKSKHQESVQVDSTATEDVSDKTTPTLAEALSQVCNMLNRLGNMPSSTSREKTGKKAYRDKIENQLAVIMNNYPEYRSSLQAIINRMHIDSVLGEPDNVTDVAGRIYSYGSRYHCDKIVNFIKSIITKL